MDKIDEQIASLREGNTLTENEVKALCDKVTSNRQSCGVSQRVCPLLPLYPLLPIMLSYPQ